MKASHFFPPLLVIAYLLVISCATSEPTSRGSRPTHDSAAPEYITDEQLEKEIQILENHLVENPNDTDKIVKLASIFIDLKDKKNAIRTLERLKALNYRSNPKVYASLGQLYDKEGEFSEARVNYTLFRELTIDNPSLVKRTETIIAQLDFKIKTLDTPYDITLSHLSSDINTGDSEYLSQFTLDAEQIIFTRRFNNQEDLFLAKKTEEGYKISPIAAVNTPLNEGAHTISADGSTLIFTHCNEKFGYGGCDLYSTKLQSNGEWKQPANMGAVINTRHWESQPSLSADGNTLYFSSKKPQGSLGGADIWVSKKKPDGTWSAPVNLGAEINTSGNEESPFLHADGKTLYFRTNGHASLGGFDLYMATKEDSEWQNLKHLGSPINTKGNDGALVVSLDGLKGFYATDTYHGKKLEHLDIFEFDLPEDFRPQPMTYIKGRVTDANSKNPLIAEISITQDKQQTTRYKTNYNGEFLAAIPVGQPSQMHISSKGYVFYSDYIAYEEVRHGVDPHIIDIQLNEAIPPTKKVEIEPMVLRNIFFETARAELLPASQEEINYLYKLLEDNPSIKIQLSGHTDNVGSDSDNLSLSQKRAESVKAALTSRDIVESRIQALGLGESQPLASNETPEGRAQNRRTELLIIN
jgi:outer membrane protein OmpA-like peptidoglycan-associated protein/tetratricopeptide (TPR) repeat protein